MVKAKLTYTQKCATIYAQRAKYKHWFQLGNHRATDAAFIDALQKNEVEWKVPKTTLI